MRTGAGGALMLTGVAGDDPAAGCAGAVCEGNEMRLGTVGAGSASGASANAGSGSAAAIVFAVAGSTRTGGISEP
jgi:hypothetical protein